MSVMLQKFPELSEFHWLPLDEVQHPLLQLGRDHWLAIKGQRLFPARRQLRPKAVAPALKHMSLVKIIDGGADFEFRIVGDAHVRAFRVPLHRRRFSDIATEAPHLVETAKTNFLKVVQTLAPVAYHGQAGRQAQDVLFTDVESVLLPFGESDAAVDHIAVFAVYSRR